MEGAHISSTKKSRFFVFNLMRRKAYHDLRDFGLVAYFWTFFMFVVILIFYMINPLIGALFHICVLACAGNER